MFSHSYDPLGREYLLPPGSFQTRKKKERAHRRRAVEVERRRRTELLEGGGSTRHAAGEDSTREDRWRRGGVMPQQCQIAGVEWPRRCRLDSIAQGDDDLNTVSTSSYPPSFIYARVFASHDEMDQGFENHPRESINMKTAVGNPEDGDMVKLQRQAIMRIANPPTESKIDIEDDDNESYLPPHIIGEEDMSDYEDDLEG
ncbi:hypothetical protein ACHAW5_010028 [Stephanodiscus triporus]|uniref:Uncharacterized protein n=1 Tax=Stephanodiscus triporus TaxID=2934178 RepID=A0ABD3N1E0_9STRA